MRVIFCGKKTLRLPGLYLLAFCLLAAGAGALWPAVAAVSANSDPLPWRCGPADSAYVSLAINVDWGEEYLPGMLAVLREKQVTATFFLTGRWCDNNPALAREISLSGHELGNHGYSHTSPNASTKQQVQEELLRTEEAVLNATGMRTRLYAPPSGEDDPHVLAAAAACGYQTVLWSVDTIDWQKPDAATVISRVTEKIHGGAIILAHPTASTLEALPVLIDELTEKGYEFVCVSENLGL